MSHVQIVQNCKKKIWYKMSESFIQYVFSRPSLIRNKISGVELSVNLCWITVGSHSCNSSIIIYKPGYPTKPDYGINIQGWVWG